MSTEDSRVRIKLPNAPELVGAVVGAAGHLARRAGFDAAAHSALLDLTEQACRDQVAALPREDSTLDVTLEDFSDRVELTFEHETANSADSAGKPKQEPAYPHADKVETAVSGNLSHLKLTKFARNRSAPGPESETSGSST